MDVWEVVARESVRRTLSDYTAGTDRFDLHAVGGCFAPDGMLDIAGADESLIGPQGVEAGLAKAVGGSPDPDRLRPTHVRHHVSSIRFGAVTVDRIEVSSYFAVYTDVGLDHWGRYRDVLVPVFDRWLFLQRRISVDAFAPNSLMSPA